ncbi:tetratricopeptide repeat protein 16 [Psammomys obesus]|uniref:tetratricopeptide repeat protein 16 n=1 Tax=Psammomys obesus TaxID=48139 RepID=UPI002452FA74|nr:tetratricopeptide repeat protein 16 [Psammomys obesus]
MSDKSETEYSLPASASQMQESKEPDNAKVKKIVKLKVPEPREKILRRIFGSSQVFYRIDDIQKPKISGTSVPVKVKEYFHEGHKCLEQEDWETAVLFFSRALHLNPSLVDFYIFRAEAFIQLCDFSSALQNLRRAYTYEPDNTKYLRRLSFMLYLQGQCLFELCEFQEALYVFLQASDLQPQNPSFSYRCIACLLALKRPQECLSLITREVKQGRATADVYILRAQLYNYFQKAKLCYQDLQSALNLDPKHPQAKGLLQMMVDQAKKSLQDASILAVQGKLHRALKRISCAIENNPLDPNLYLFRGTLHRRLQQFNPAVEDFLKALDMVTDNQSNLARQAQRQLLLTYNDFAVYCYTQGAYQEGVLLLNKAIRDEQNEKGLYINRGDCFFQLGNLVFAEADYSQALALSPQDEGANFRMGALQEKMGLCLQKRRQFQTAEHHFSLAIKHDPKKAQYYLHRAKIRQVLQNLMGARQDVATVLLLNPNFPKIAPVMNSLFPGMTVENVLNSQMAQLAKLELSRMIESGQKASHPQNVVVQRLMDRKKARALLESWNQGVIFTEIPEEDMETLQTLKEKEEVAKEKKAKAAQKLTSLTDSYLDQSSSSSVFSSKSLIASGLELSTSQEYRSSTSTTAVMPSERVLPKPQTDPRKIRKILGLSRGSRVSQVSEHQKQYMLETTPTYGVRHNSNKPEANQGPKPKPRKTEAAQEPTQTSSATDVTEGSKPGKTRATLSPKERLRRARAVRAQSWKLKAQSNWASSQSQAKKSQDKPPGSIPGEENSSHSESPETNFSKADSILDLSLQSRPILTFMLPDK